VRNTFIGGKVCKSVSASCSLRGRSKNTCSNRGGGCSKMTQNVTVGEGDLRV
jgi:hypothetical protein